MKGAKAMKRTQPKPGVALYLRVSSKDKQHPAASFEYQRQRIQGCIERAETELPVLAEYKDILPGKNPKRPGFHQMLNEARAGLFSHLAVYSVDRIGRNTQDTLNIIDELSELGVEILVADTPNLDIDTPNGNLFLRIRVAIAQYEVELMSQRVVDTKKTVLQAGGWPSQLPDGYRRKVEQ
jgi:DNA invertase Pin-like site-specific DNA recombinase